MCWKKLTVVTFRAQRSVSRPCPIRMVSALMTLNKASCTSLSEVQLPFTSSSLMPENLYKCHTGHQPSCWHIQDRWINTTVGEYRITLPRVIVDHLIIRRDKGVVDDLQTGVDQRHSGQFQAINGETLKTRINTLHILFSTKGKTQPNKNSWHHHFTIQGVGPRTAHIWGVSGDGWHKPIETEGIMDMQLQEKREKKKKKKNMNSPPW